MQVAKIAVIVTLLAGCSGETNKPSDGAILVDVQAEADAFFADNPTAIGVALLRSDSKGFEIYEDGRAVFVAFGAISNLRQETRVVSVEGSKLCVAQNGSWSGACMNIYMNPNGTFFLDGTFGNGLAFTDTVEASPIFSN